MEKFLKIAISHIPHFIGMFTNLVIGPRRTAKDGLVFNQENFSAALLFFGICLLIAQVLKAPMLPSSIPMVQHLAADAVWKMVIVLIESVIIAGTMRLLKGKFAIGNYIVANCYYFGVLSVLSHLVLLSGNQLINLAIPGMDVYMIYHALGFGLIAFWMLIAWSTYGEFNQFGWIRTATALCIVLIFSMPALLFAKLLRDALVPTLYPGFHY